MAAFRSSRRGRRQRRPQGPPGGVQRLVALPDDATLRMLYGGCQVRYRQVLREVQAARDHADPRSPEWVFLVYLRGARRAACQALEETGLVVRHWRREVPGEERERLWRLHQRARRLETDLFRVAGGPNVLETLDVIGVALMALSSALGGEGGG